MGSNRIAILGSLITAWGFFFLPLLIVIPNRVAVQNVAFQLLEIEGDQRYFFLFLLCWVPLFLSFETNQLRRGWLLAGFGTLIMVLSVWLPAIAAAGLLENARELLVDIPEDQIVNPRVRPVSGVIVGALGGYVIVFAGLRDLRQSGVNKALLTLTGLAGIAIIYYLFLSDRLDAFSIVTEYNIRGETLFEDILKHLAYVLVALAAGLVIGIGLGFWASRQERVAPIILYIVGIIQTIPSLALFGLLLVPLSNLGKQELINDVLVYALPALIGLSVLVFVIVRLIGNLLPESAQIAILGLIGAAMVVPMFIVALITISLLFQTSFLMLTTTNYSAGKAVLVLSSAALLVVNIIGRQWRVFKRNEQLTHRVRYALYALLAISGLYVFGATGNDYLPTDEALNTWTLGDVGIRGLGETPTLVALSLYSLLPLVRNTYTGLNNVDNAIIDSGRGMGMTPRQIFFKIELPLAFPVIMAGVRNAAIALVGIATIAATIGGGALGDYVLDGANSIAPDLILLGTIPAIFLAFSLDAGLQVLETILTSPGIRQEQESSGAL